MKEQVMEVKTKAGILRAYKSQDPGQPGIYIVLQPTGYEEEIDMSYVCVFEDEEYMTKDNERDIDVCIYTYGDATTEDWTSKDIVRREHIIAGLGT